MGIMDLFKKIGKNIKNLTRWKEYGTYKSSFYGFGTDMYKSEIVRSCIRPLAEHSSKANPKSSNKAIERILTYSPNMYMNGKDFLYKVRTHYELKNTAFILIMRDETEMVTGFYPVPYISFEAFIDARNNLYIKFQLAGGITTILPWNDLAVLRKDYNESDIAGDNNDAILNTLELIATSNEGISNAIKSTANLRGIIKLKKSMLDNEDVKKRKDEFVKDYLNSANEGGIAALDTTMDFEAITMNPTVANWAQMKEFRENVYRYFGENEKIITSSYSEEEFDAFYESKIEPFLVALGLELTRKIFSVRSISFNNYIRFESNRLQYASNKTKLSMVSLVDRGALTPNEWREIFNLSPVEGGDKPIRRLDTAAVDDNKANESEGEEDE